jgi:hypothetical protein
MASRWKRPLRWTMLLLAVLTGAELVVRASRIDDVPLYLADRRIGYLPAPNQQGAFLWTNRWAFNEASMGTPEPFSARPGSILLIGDSIVFGGNPYRQEERLGPQLARATGRPVWPVGAGSWALQNQLQYAHDHPAIVRSVDQVVLVLNSGDFGAPSSWSDELTHPRRRSWLASWRQLRKFVLRPAPPKTPSGMQVTPRPLGAMLAGLLPRLRRPMIVILYPAVNELSNRASCGFSIPALLRRPNVRIQCVKSAAVWTRTAYRDGIHPSPEGMTLLARLVARSLSGDPSASARRR